MKLTTIFKSTSGIQLMIIPMLYEAKISDKVELISRDGDMKLEVSIEEKLADVVTVNSITRTFITKSL